MFTPWTLIAAAFTAVVIKLDKNTQYTHPTLHVLALAGMASVVYALVAAA